MSEDFLSYLWFNRLFQSDQLRTISGEDLVVLDPGWPNSDSGPDFFNARIKIGNTIWAGNVEIHVRSSDWLKHGHSSDRAYDNVILHVVGNHDVQIESGQGKFIPALEIPYDNRLLLNYQSLMHSEQWVPCQGRISGIEPAVVKNWLDRMAAERLEIKSESVIRVLEDNHNDWEETFYRFLARSFGMRLNAFPFEMLAASVPLKYLLRQQDSLLQIEAILFGQAGFLKEELEDNYHSLLRREYQFFSAKYSLRPIQLHLWKFLRLRPLNFPTVRIAQLASLISGKQSLFSSVLDCSKPEELKELLRMEPSEYWRDHYLFGKKSPKSSKKSGKQLIDSILINGVVPVLFSYGRLVTGEKHRQLAFDLLQEIPPENNFVIRAWKNNSIIPQSALESQALLHLRSTYCNKRSCLSCAIGSSIILRELPDTVRGSF